MMWKKLAIACIGCVVVGGVIRYFPKPPLSAAFPSSTAIYDSRHTLLRLTLSSDDKYRLWIPLHSYSPVLIAAVLLHEDQHFYHHVGINPMSLVRALYRTYVAGPRRMGGSTITMQLARLMYGIQSRSPTGKMIQMLRAIQLEMLYSKDEILEAYLNLAPFGRNVEGVATASLIYFGKTVDRLSVPEALTLAVIPQSPALRTHHKGINPVLMNARKRLFQRWRELHPESGDAEFAVLGPVTMTEIENLPFLAPHLITSLLSGSPSAAEIQSTLDLDLQRLLERQAKSYVARHGRVGVHNVSALLVDYRTMSVKALLGSADFFDDELQGQVNGTTAKRSPGSALKPFVYALALDQGLIHPMTVLKDTPLALGPFSPENFDGQFMGPLTAKEALIRSRNVPAVALSSRLSAPNYYGFLRMAGISQMKSENHYGPSLVIGGFEVTMEEMATLYAMLANRGVLKPLRFIVTDPKEDIGQRLISEEASTMVMDMLKDTPRPEERYSLEWVSDQLPVYWKTGTSYGFRDAWTAGIFGPYVLVVWVGNFNGEGNPAFIGIRAAAPLFFQMMDAIRSHHGGLQEPHRPPPPHLKTISVCAVSGGIPGPFCTHTKRTAFIPGKSPIQGCDVHRQVLVDATTGLQACLPHHGPVRSEIYEFWPSDVLKVFQQAGIPRRIPPPFGQQCSLTAQMARGVAPHITSPHDGVIYTLSSSAPGHDTIAFTATTDFDVRDVYWFVNSSFVGKASSSGPFLWTALPGDYTIRAVDDLGRHDSRFLKVVMAQ